MSNKKPVPKEWGNIPQELKDLRQWVCWEWKEKEGKMTKIPVNPNGGGFASSTDPGTWNTFEVAVKVAAQHPSRFNGIGFMVSESDPYIFIDLDHCVDDNGEIEDWARDIIREFNTYTEYSYSGHGIHIICQGGKPGPRCRTSQHPNFEIYDKKRFVVMTGNVIAGNIGSIALQGNEVYAIYHKMFGDDAQNTPKEKTASAPIDISDQDLLEHIIKSACGENFRNLYAGDVSRYNGDDSAADLVLCNYLAFWTGRDPVRMDRMFRSSGLYRDKWEREDYRTWTINKAIEGTKDVWKGPKATRSENQPDKKEGKKSQATLLFGFAFDYIREVFLTPDGHSFVAVDLNDTIKIFPIRSTDFRRFLRWLYMMKTNEAANSQTIKNVEDHIDSEAAMSGNKRPVFNRLGYKDGVIYLDMVNDRWEAIKITADGWGIVTNPPVAFRRGNGMLGLPMPEKGGSLDMLREFVNISDDDWILYVSYLLSTFMPEGPYPILSINGEQGTAKSTASRIIKALADPNAAPLRKQPRDEEAAKVAAVHNWVVAYDNVSTIPDWFSDLLAALSTGIGLGDRAKFTDDDEALFAGKRPVILNGIPDLINRSDLANRALLITLLPISEEQRLEEQEFYRRFEKQKRLIFGAILDAVSCALRNIPSTRLERKPRMADFAKWIVAAEESLPWEAGTFMETYAANRKAADSLMLEGNPVAKWLVSWISEQGTWEGMTEELFNIMMQDNVKNDLLPKTAKGFSQILKRIAPNLRNSGLEIDLLKRTNKGRPIRISSTAMLLELFPVSDAYSDASSEKVTHVVTHLEPQKQHASPVSGFKTEKSDASDASFPLSLNRNNYLGENQVEGSIPPSEEDKNPDNLNMPENASLASLATPDDDEGEIF